MPAPNCGTRIPRLHADHGGAAASDQSDALSKHEAITCEDFARSPIGALRRRRFDESLGPVKACAIRRRCKRKPANQLPVARQRLDHHLTMEMFRLRGYPSNTCRSRAALSATQLIGGQFPSCSRDTGDAKHINGTLRGLARDAQRSQFLPELPDHRETGYSGFEAVGWIGIAGARTPDAVGISQLRNVKLLTRPM